MARPRLFDNNDKPGRIKEHSGPNLPPNHLWCDGTLVTVLDYPELYAEIGTTYNTGGESAGVNFRLPNKIGRTSIGAGTYTDAVSGSVTRTRGQALGAEAHILTTPQMPSHSHPNTLNDPGHNHIQKDRVGTTTGGNVAFGSTGLIDNNTSVTGTQNSMTNITITNANAGSGSAHNNMPPTLVTGFIIRY